MDLKNPKYGHFSRNANLQWLAVSPEGLDSNRQHFVAVYFTQPKKKEAIREVHFIKAYKYKLFLMKITQMYSEPVKRLRWSFAQRFLSKLFDWVLSTRLNYTSGHQNTKTKIVRVSEKHLKMHIITAIIRGKVQTNKEIEIHIKKYLS